MQNRTDRILLWIIIGAVVAAVFVPLYVSQTLFFPFISGKNFAFRILAEVAFAAWLILALRNSAYRPRRSLVAWSVLFFIGALTLATFFAEDPYKSFWSNFERMEGLVGMIHFALFFFVAGSVFRAKEWRLFVLATLGVNTVVIGYALLQFFGFFAINQGGVRIDATFGNAIYLGVYGLFHTFLAARAALAARAEGRPMFIVAIFGVLALANAALVVLSATRGAILGLFVGVLAACVYLACSAAASPRVRRFGLIGCTLAALAVGGFFAARAVPALKSHPVFGRVLSASPMSDDAQARFVIWGIALKGFAERPLVGWGLEGFNFVFNKHYDPVLHNREQWFDRAHNTYLDWLVASGIVGFFGYLALWYASARAVFRKENKFLPPQRALFLGFGAAYAVHNVFAFDNGVSHFLFFILLAYAHYRTSEHRKTENREQGTPVVLSKAVMRVGAPVIVIALAFSMYWVNVRPVYAGTLLLRALHAHPEGPLQNLAIFQKALALHTFATGEIREQLAQVTSAVAPLGQVSIAIKQEFLAFAVSELDAQIKQRPADARPYTFMGALLDAFRLYDQGLLYWREAIAHSPKKQMLLFQAGVNRINAGKLSEGLPYFKEAYELNPENQEAVIVYVAALVYAGDRETEKKVLATPSYSEHQSSDIRLIRAYEAVGRLDDAQALLRDRLERMPHDEFYAAWLQKLENLKKQ